jgi:chaperone protein EcpD
MYPHFTLASLFSKAFFAALFVAMFGGSALLTGAQAEVIIETTRIIYPEVKREVTFKVVNVSKDKPALVQMWLDDGNASATPEEAVTPFNLTPPVAKLKADGSQVVRLTFTGEPLPSDRESVFWFNMLELPQKSNAENKLTFAIRTRIKVFFRPKQLKGEQAEFMDQVTWKVVQKDGKWMAEATNPSPYHMSFFSLNFGNEGKFDLSIDGGMVPPKGTASFLIGDDKKITKPYSALRVEYVSDYGGSIAKESAVKLGN